MVAAGVYWEDVADHGQSQKPFDGQNYKSGFGVFKVLNILNPDYNLLN